MKCSASGIQHSALLLSVLAVACVPNQDRERLKQTTQASYDQQTGRLQRLTYDANKNGRIDTWTYMDGKTILRSEIDRDEDGAVDRWEYHAPDGSVERIRTAEDDDGDGKPDRWETYIDGRIASVAPWRSTRTRMADPIAS
jgi:hypothetical protein